MTAEAAQFRYAAFISYSHANEAEAGRLHRALENFRLPRDVTAPSGMPASRGRIAPVFRDREELSSSPDLSAAIREALAAASALIVICSPKAKASRWVNAEIETFKRLHGEGRVYAFLIEGEPQDSFPPALLRKLGPDGELSDEEGEPLAADIRPGKDGWKLGVLKIAAGLLDTGLDSLRQRELQRERRRLLVITGLSSAVAAGALGLASWALYASNVASQERARAEREAKTANATAEFMVELFEIADPGEARGRKVTAEEILQRGVARIEESLKDEPAVQGDLMYAMGRANFGLGLYAEASKLLETARQKQVTGNKGSISVLRTDNMLAMSLYEEGRYEKAEEIYEKISPELGRETKDGQSRLLFAESLSGLGDIKKRSNDFVAAEKFYRSAATELSAHGLADSEEFARASLGLGQSLWLQERFEEAEAELKTAFKAFRASKGANHFSLGLVDNEFANLYYTWGKLPAAAQYLEDALAIYQMHFGPDHPETAIALNNLGRLKLELGHIDEAQTLIADAIRIQRERSLADHVDFAFYLNTMAIISAERSDYEASATFLQEALSLVKSNDHRLYGPIMYNLGRAKCQLGRVEEGLMEVQSGRAALAAHYGDGDSRYGEADEFEARCLVRMSESRRAREFAQRGYESLLASRGPDHYFTQRARRFLESIPAN